MMAQQCSMGEEVAWCVCQCRAINAAERVHEWCLYL